MNMVSESKIRILIVEDEAIVAFDLEQGLKSAGYTVCGVAPSGEEAISLVEKESPDLILMDIRLRSRMTGIEAAKIIRSRFEIPIIYLTAHSDETTLEQAKQTHPYGYLVKPFGQRELRSAIETGLYRAKAEKSLSDSSRWNRLIIDSAHNAFVAMGSDGTISDWNPAAESIFGWKREEVLGKVLAETIIPVNLRAAHYRGLERYLKTGVGPVLNKVLELRALHRDGHEFPVELTIATSDIQGKSHFLSFIRDISERKRLEIEQKRREELERSNEDLERFAHLTSHDLQEPLRTLTMYTELLASRLGSDLGEEEKQFMDYIIGGAERMRELIDDLLSYSRVGTKETTVERIEIKSVIASVLESLGASVASSGATITHDPLPAIMGHFGQIGHLFQNLIANAIKFRREESPPGFIYRQSGRVSIGLLRLRTTASGLTSALPIKSLGFLNASTGETNTLGPAWAWPLVKK